MGKICVDPYHKNAKTYEQLKVQHKGIPIYVVHPNLWVTSTKVSQTHGIYFIKNITFYNIHVATLSLYPTHTLFTENNSKLITKATRASCLRKMIEYG